MCGRFTLAADGEAVQAAFNLIEAPIIVARYNIAPTQPVAIILNQQPRKAVFHRWGLIPGWAKDMSSTLINARSESAAEKPSFRSAFRRRRCIVPADGWYEWNEADKNKVPNYFHFNNHRVFGIAGLWEVWQSPDGGEVPTFSLLTTDANNYVSSVHNRMPVILHPEDYNLWLSDADEPVEVLQSLMQPYGGGEITTYRVPKTVNKAGVEGATLIQPLLEERLL